MLHFDQPYKHARHYVGWTADLLDRLDPHANGHGARLVAVIWHAGIGFTLIRICEGTRRPERAIKNDGGAVRYCPACTPRPWNGHWQPCPAASSPAPTPTSPEGGNPHAHQRNGSGRNQRNNPYQLEELFIKFHRTPAGIAWRWRTELLTLAFIAAALRRLDTWTTLTWAAIILAGLLAVTFAVPHSRRFITRRAWCVLARHRLQRLCYEARLHTRSGRLPLILWTRPTKVGERTWVLCRAGICAEDFEAHIGELRAACYARDARVTRNRRWSHLITIDIIRRDTLAAARLITSPLERLTAHYHIGQLELVPPMDSPPDEGEPAA